jgi:hypothetical protein
MAFESIQFKYAPPPTVAAALPIAQATQPVSLATGTSLTNSGNAAASASAAGKLIARLADLLDTNQYLQQVILATSTGLGIEFDPSVDPETARALQTIYSNLPVPTSLTISMYNRMLDAKMTVLQIESGLGTGTAYETNPFQNSAVTQINQAIESGLVSSGQSQFQTALLLGPLKGDAVLFNNMTAQLSQYPVIASPGTPSITANNPNQISILGQDVSPALASTLNSSLDSFQSSYASVYQLTAGVGVVAQDVNNVLNQFFLEPPTNLVRMIPMLQALQGFSQAPRLDSIVNGMTGTVFVQLISEAAGMVTMADRFMQTAVQPLKGSTSNIGQMVSQIQAASAMANVVVNGAKQNFVNATGGLKGCSLAYNSGLPTAPVSSSALVPASTFQVPGVGAMTPGLMTLATHLDWANTTVSNRVSVIQESFQKLLNRRTGDMNAQMDIIASTQALNTLTQLAKAVMTYNSSQPAVGATNSVTQTAAVSQILSGMSSTTGTSFVVTNGQMQAVSPIVPAPPSNVQTVLTNGGVNLIVASSSTVQAPTIGAVS